jgi:hypothetical protein
MSALWVLGLGASMGYLYFKRQTIENRLDLSVAEWEGAGAKESDPSPPEGANLAEIKQAWKYTDDTRNRDFNERLPGSDRIKYKMAQQQLEGEVTQYDAGPSPDIEGVYLEQTVPF